MMASAAAARPIGNSTVGIPPPSLWSPGVIPDGGTDVDGRGVVGAIPSVTAPFCAQCDRVRLTAEGTVRSCLFSLEETDLRAALRSGGTDDDLAAALSTCVAGKGAGHAIGSTTFVQPPRSMSRIGG